MNKVEAIKIYKPKTSFFVGVDSDGCVFDTMEIKHKKVLIPLAIKIWQLDSLAKEYQEIAEYINLYSEHRGVNRFEGLVMALRFLESRPEVQGINSIIPDYRVLEEFVENAVTLSNGSLKEFIKKHNCKFLKQVLDWSEEGDRLLEVYTRDNQPFEFAKKSLEKMSGITDLMIISSATVSGLEHEWKQGDVLKYVQLIGGQEIGPKKKQLAYAIENKYEKEKVLLIGDGLGDMKAAVHIGISFFPIIPGMEETSWRLFYSEAFQLFIDGSYSGTYEETQIAKFLEVLKPDF